MKLIKYITIGILWTSVVYADPIVTQSTSNSTVSTTGKTETEVKSPPPSAISPSINTSNSDLCTVGVSGAVQTQILGLSGGKTISCNLHILLKKLERLSFLTWAIVAIDFGEEGTPCSRHAI